MERKRSSSRPGHHAWIAFCVTAMLVIPGAATPTAATLDQIKQTGRLRLGYRTDARPLSFRDESGNAAGYSVALCQQVADAIKTEFSLPQLKVEWVPVSLESRVRVLQQGEVDILCGAETATLSRRTQVAFSIPIFPGGIGALVRTDAPARLREVLAGRPGQVRPFWRGSIDPSLHAGKLAAVAGTTAEKWLANRANEFQIATLVTQVPSYDAGVSAVADRVSNVLFGDRALLLDAAARSPAARDLVVLDRLFTYEPVALVLPRGDEDLRLVVDRALSRYYRSGGAAELYTKCCGEPDMDTLAFFRLHALPD